MDIKRFVCNMIQENCYVVSDETGECVIIDCGAWYEQERNAIVSYIDGNGLKPVHLLATHGHLDHNFGNNTIFEHYGLKPEVHADDANLMEDLKGQAEQMFDLTIDYDFPPVGRFLENGETVSFGNHALKVIATPGHTPGGVCFYCAEEHTLFAGDTLFRQSIGRTDFPGGSMFMMINSLRELVQLPDETVVCPGHGRDTTIGWELSHNPYIDR